MARYSIALRLLALQLTVAATIAAQQEPKPADLPDAPVPKQENPPQKHENPISSTVGILEKRSIFFPDLATSPGPLRPAQKFELSADKSIAPSQLVSSAFGASIGQAQNSLAGYGQEWVGYGRRFGSSLATAASSHFFGTFLLAAALHDDPRYFVSMRGGVGHRIAYSLTRLVVTRTDRGKSAVNWPGLLGPLLAESLASSYLPVSEQTARRTFQRYGIRIGFTAAGNLAKEYWPTIFRSLRFTGMLPPPEQNPGSSPPSAPTGTPPQPQSN